MNDTLSRMRHSAAHVLATAVLDVFPDAELGIGPPTDDGFYYDFLLPRALTPDDLKQFEALMRKHVAADYPFEYAEHERSELLERFREDGQSFKVELIDDLAADETLSTYTSGPFVDLCRGPHVESTGQIGAYKLLSIAGAYWRGDERRPQLQRIYGTAFATRAELKAHLQRLEEAKKRDHRLLSRQLDLFSFNPLVGAGLVLWHPKGGVIRETLEDFWRAEHRRRGYDLVYSPHIGRKELWETSGHTQFFADGLFPEMELENQTFINKPMNCPFHVQIFASGTRSYRDLPLAAGRAWVGLPLRALGHAARGAARARHDAGRRPHLLPPDQFVDEVSGVIDLTQMILGTFGFSDYAIDVSVRADDDRDKYAGDDELWELAEQGLVEALNRHGLEFRRVPGEAAFYGPKIDVHLVDAIGRTWQLTTIQVDFNLPERFDITYEAADGSRERPVMVHRAIMGTIERFTAILIEHFAGAFPVWLSPVQAVVIPIADRHADYGQGVVEQLRAAGLRAELDARSERMNRKIRDAQLQKAPYMLIAGDRDIAAGHVSVRLRTGEDLKGMPVDTFLDAVRPVVESRAHDTLGFDVAG